MKKAIRQLDGHLPYFLAAGNHDYGNGGRATDRSTKLDDYFPKAWSETLPSSGETCDQEPEK
ncbi:MAG: hypothetical protein AB8D78_13955 [Akkermansiaceae bacterium]